MPVVTAGALSIVAEVTRTSGTGPYLPVGGVARAAKFAQFYAVSETFDYFVDNGGGLAEYGFGQLNVDGTIERLAIHWTSSGGIGGPPISWPLTGRRFIRSIAAGGGTVVLPTAKTINGFWNSTVPTSTAIERYLFAEAGTLKAGLPGSIVVADSPATAISDQIVTEDGESIVDEADDLLMTGGFGNFIVTQAGDQLVDENGNEIVDSLFSGGTPVVILIKWRGIIIGTITFNPGIRNGIIQFDADVVVSIGDIFELISAVENAGLGDLVWTFVVSP